MKTKKDPSKFLVPDDVTDQEIVKIADEGEEVESQYGTRLQIGIKLAGGIVKKTTLNPTSKANLIDEFGDETLEWVGKEVRVHKTKSKVGKEMKTVLYFTSPNKDIEGNVINE